MIAIALAALIQVADTWAPAVDGSAAQQIEAYKQGDDGTDTQPIKTWTDQQIDAIREQDKTAPTSLENCIPEPPQAFLYQGQEVTAWMDQAGVWHVAPVETV